MIIVKADFDRDYFKFVIDKMNDLVTILLLDSWIPNCNYFSFYFSLNHKFFDLESEQRISNKIYKKLSCGSTDAHLSVYHIYRFVTRKLLKC